MSWAHRRFLQVRFSDSTLSPMGKAYKRNYPEKWRAGRKRTLHRRKERIRVWVLDYKLAHPCICGESDPSCLDFHHRDPKEKSGGISKMAERSLGQVQKEVLKCEVICSNCHRKGHAGHPRPEHLAFFPCAVIPICGESIIRITPPTVSGVAPHPPTSLAGQLTLSL